MVLLPVRRCRPSGKGAYHGIDGFKTFSHAKAVFKQVGRDLTAMMRPPYGDGIRKMLAGQIKA